MSKTPIILGIESSCDDTSAAILQGQKILSNIVASQEIHTQYGGVVPELASRAHQQNIIPVVDAAIKKANLKKEDISAIAFTKGPGLLGSLLVGSSFAKSFAMGMDIPLIAVNHMQGHILSHFIDEEKAMPEFPFLCLTVSGGHTQIVRIESTINMQVIGTTIDDAAGEAFDKSAKILGLPYPGGPLIDKHAQQGNPKKFIFPKPKVSPLDFSFSGLKTAVLYFVQKNIAENPNFIEENLADICASLQHTIVGYLMDKLKNAVKQTGITQVAIGGGVSANSGIRKALEEAEQKYGWRVHIPKFEFCTDNAAMIAMVGELKYKQKHFADNTVTANARMKL